MPTRLPMPKPYPRKESRLPPPMHAVTSFANPPPFFVATLLIGTALFVTGCPSIDPPPFRKASPPPDVDAEKGTIGMALEGALLKGPRARGVQGDWAVRNNRLAAIVRKADGRLVDLGFRKEGKDLLHYASTAISDTRDRYEVHYHSAKVLMGKDGDPGALLLLGRVRARDLNLEVHTRISAPEEAPYLELETKVRNVGNLPVYRVGVGDTVYLGNSRLFVPGHGLVDKSARVHGRWVAREGPGFTLALVSAERGPMEMRFSMGFPGYNPTVVATAKWAHLAKGEALTAKRYLVLSRGSLTAASTIIQKTLGGPLTPITMKYPHPPKGHTAKVVVQRGGKPALQATLSGSGRDSLSLPAHEGYRAALWVSGAGRGAWATLKKGAGEVSLQAPPWGTLDYRVADKNGAPLPARLEVRGIEGTKDPSFGHEGFPKGVFNMVYSASGRGRFALAPGTYEVTVTRGTDYSLARSRVTIKEKTSTPLQANLRKEIRSPGALTADLHLHSRASSDSPLTVQQRLTQLVAGGVQVAVATDHNAVTSYEPSVKKLALAKWIRTFPGCEVTTRRSYFGHFNLYPLKPGSRVPVYENTPPEKMLATWRARKDKPLVQINHPRMSYIGTFNQVGFDRERGRFYSLKLPDDYDAIEVFNGDRLYAPHRVQRNLKDWYILLNRGWTATATGGSDSHLAGYHEVGYPKNYLFVGHDSPKKLTHRAFRKAIRNHRVVVSTGPYLNVTKTGPRAEGLAAPSKNTLIGSRLKAPQTVLVTLESPSWLKVDRLEVIANGVPLTQFEIPSPPDGKPLRWQRRVALNPTRDTWFVFIAKSRSTNPHLPKPGAIIMAFTNPIWVDAQGDGNLQLPQMDPGPTR